MAPLRKLQFKKCIHCYNIATTLMNLHLSQWCSGLLCFSQKKKPFHHRVVTTNLQYYTCVWTQEEARRHEKHPQRHKKSMQSSCRKSPSLHNLLAERWQRSPLHNRASSSLFFLQVMATFSFSCCRVAGLKEHLLLLFFIKETISDHFQLRIIIITAVLYLSGCAWFSFR